MLEVAAWHAMKTGAICSEVLPLLYYNYAKLYTKMTDFCLHHMTINVV